MLMINVLLIVGATYLFYTGWLRTRDKRQGDKESGVSV
jgi:threonine/homoserine/homoserine lactone efflux protein